MILKIVFFNFENNYQLKVKLKINLTREKI